jgi:acetyl-CoA synthetase
VPNKPYQAAVDTFQWADALAALGWSGRDTVALATAIVDRHAAGANGARTALLWLGADGAERRVSYRDLAEASARVANLLVRLGVRKGDRVATLMPRVPETFAAILGILKAGAVFVPIFAGFGPDAVRYRLRHSGATLLVTHADHRDQVPDGIVARVVCVRATRATDIDFRAALSRESTSFQPVALRRDEPAAIIYTSGSTGLPKGCVIAVNLLCAIWPYLRYGLDLQAADDLFWPTGDPGWGYGLVCYLEAFAAGATVLCLQPNPTAQRCLEMLSAHRVTNLATTPTLLRGLMALGEAPMRAGTAAVRAIASCGEPLNAEVVSCFRRAWNVTPMDHYGATELGLPIGNYHALEMPVKPGSMGLPSPGYRMAVVDEAGRVLPHGEVGLIGLEPSADRLYWTAYRNDEAASRGVRRGDWICSGDLARRDEDGYFWFEGRADDIIESAGYRIGPFEVESCLLKHPAVAEAAVVGKPDPQRGEIVKASVVLKAGALASDALADELAALVRRDLGRHQYPREIDFIDELPKTQTGKIQRYLLRQRAA